LEIFGHSDFLAWPESVGGRLLEQNKSLKVSGVTFPWMTCSVGNDCGMAEPAVGMFRLAGGMIHSNFVRFSVTIRYCSKNTSLLFTNSTPEFWRLASAGGRSLVPLSGAFPVVHAEVFLAFSSSSNMSTSINILRAVYPLLTEWILLPTRNYYSGTGISAGS
jgi:hypothetical protein